MQAHLDQQQQKYQKYQQQEQNQQQTQQQHSQHQQNQQNQQKQKSLDQSKQHLKQHLKQQSPLPSPQTSHSMPVSHHLSHSHPLSHSHSNSKLKSSQQQSKSLSSTTLTYIRFQYHDKAKSNPTVSSLNTLSNSHQQQCFDTKTDINPKTNATTIIQFPIAILQFNIQLLNNDHNQPYPLPSQIVNNSYPFTIMKQFLESHNYSPKNFHVTKPINSSNYANLVDPVTFQCLSRFVHPDQAQHARQVVDLTRFIRFHQLHDAVCAAIATNYYIPPNDDKELARFKKLHRLDSLSPEEVCEIIKEYEDVFSLIETKAKEQLLGEEEGGDMEDGEGQREGDDKGEKKHARGQEHNIIEQGRERGYE